MTPKEKAKQLVKKFEPYMPFIDQIDYSINMDKRTRHAKQCALIAVDEIIKQLEQYGYYKSLMTYWDAVKQEIENYEIIY